MKTQDLEQFFERILAEKDKALVLQHAEYERRLEALNHAHEQAVEVQHTYVTQDKYDGSRQSDTVALGLALESVNKNIDRTNESVAVVIRWQNKAVGAAVVLSLFASFIGAVVMRVLS